MFLYINDDIVLVSELPQDQERHPGQVKSQPQKLNIKRNAIIYRNLWKVNAADTCLSEKHPLQITLFVRSSDTPPLSTYFVGTQPTQSSWNEIVPRDL